MLQERGRRLTTEQEQDLRLAVIHNDPAGFTKGLFSVPKALSAANKSERLSLEEARLVGAAYLLGQDLGINLAKKNNQVKIRRGVNHE